MGSLHIQAKISGKGKSAEALVGKGVGPAAVKPGAMEILQIGSLRAECEFRAKVAEFAAKGKGAAKTGIGISLVVAPRIQGTRGPNTETDMPSIVKDLRESGNQL